MNSDITNDTWWYQSPDPYQSLESEFGFPSLSTDQSLPSDIYTTLDSSSGSTTPSGSEALSSTWLSYKSDSLTNDGPKTLKSVNEERKEKRRAQNRSAQRAYRDRMAAHQKALEETIAQMRIEYSKLSRFCAEQSREAQRLRRRISELDGQVRSMQNGVWDDSGSELCWQVPMTFDLVPHMNDGGVARQSNAHADSTGSERSSGRAVG